MLVKIALNACLLIYRGYIGLIERSIYEPKKYPGYIYLHGVDR